MTAVCHEFFETRAWSEEAVLAEAEYSGFLSESKQEDHESQKTEPATDGVESAPEA